MNKDRQFRTVRGYWLRKEEGEALSPSMEDYLEMIYRICLTKDAARVHHLADMLNVQAPSVSRVLRKLKEKGYVEFRPYGTIQLTGKGQQIGEFLLDRHQTVERFLQNIGVENNLLIDTELIEHSLSDETLMRLEVVNAFLHEHPDIHNQFKSFTNQRLPCE